MNHDALSIVTRELKRRFDAALGDSRAAEAVHVGPLNDAAAKDARLVLCLYRASVNAELRNAEHRIVSPVPSMPIATFENSIPFNLHFLLSASTANANSVQGLSDLGIAIQAVNDRPYLAGSDFQSDIVHLSFEQMTTEEIGRVWALFPNVNYRMSVLILATPVWIDPAQSTLPATPVRIDRYDLSPLETRP